MGREIAPPRRPRSTTTYRDEDGYMVVLPAIEVDETPPLLFAADGRHVTRQIGFGLAVRYTFRSDTRRG